jgi:hypothetical protein
VLVGCPVIHHPELHEDTGSRDRTALFAWYNMAGSFATAAGSLAGGFLTGQLLLGGFSETTSYRSAIIG